MQREYPLFEKLWDICGKITEIMEKIIFFS